MKFKYRKYTKEYIEHLKSLPQNRHMQDYQKWVRRQHKNVKFEKQIRHSSFCGIAKRKLAQILNKAPKNRNIKNEQH